MKIFIATCVTAIVIAIIGGVILNNLQEPADRAFSTESVRLGA